MNKIKTNDIVSRNSYNNDILFNVEKIITNKTNEKIAILKGITVRIEADAPIDDLEITSVRKIKQELNEIDKQLENVDNFIDKRKTLKYGKILHLDGDRNYSIKTERYYRKRGLNAVVKHVNEYNQPAVVNDLLRKYNPDILVMTGHDGMIKNGKNFNDINNYRNSKYFIDAVKQARRFNPYNDDLIIFAGACQSFYEAIISAGANFASSPSRILIDFIDPLIVAKQVSITEKNKLIMMSDLEKMIRNGRKAIGGIGAHGKMNIT